MDRFKLSRWIKQGEVIQGATDRVNLPCLMHDTSLCQLDVNTANK